MKGVAHDHGYIVGVLQARMSSSRLPGKVLKPILGRPMLQRQVERLRRCRLIDRLVLATSDRLDDDPVAMLGERLGLTIYRGSLNDVLDRFHGAAIASASDHIVRLTADCPLTDPCLIDALVAAYLDERWDYASNCVPPTLPDGLDAEVFSRDVLETMWRCATRPEEREHVTMYVHNHPERFKIGKWTHKTDLSGLRWTVDTQADLSFVREVYTRLYPNRPAFDMYDVLSLIQSVPALSRINQGLPRNQSLSNSHEKEAPARFPNKEPKLC